ncbi:MAG: ATP-binding cassette domain-containing protein [Anaerolineales bacterium]|nr:ATP-binding cassette domain-containing protein [Anaerolineales bacterium]MDW8446224.1 ATP-binding cassette domain-containing protein [Anaerolineales bacterium]
MNHLIELHDFTLRRADRAVLTIPDLSIRQGETLAVVGPNGAGKSTFLLALAGLIRPLSGELIFAGRQIEPWKALDYRRRVALLLQEPLLLDRSVLDNLLLGLRFRKTPKPEAIRRSMEWLNRLGVVHLAQRPARSLSGGEAQRVSLARAFVLEPQLLLLDEPFAALDPPTRSELLRELRHLLRQNHTTTVLVTHHLSEAAFLGDRIAVFGEGTMKQIGSFEEIRQQPADPVVARFLAQSLSGDAYEVSLRNHSDMPHKKLDAAVY